MNKLSAAFYTDDASLSHSPSPPLSNVLERNLEFRGFHDCACRICHKCMTYAALKADLASYVKAIREHEGELRDLYLGGSCRGHRAGHQRNTARLEQEILRLHDNFMALQLAHAEIEICSRKSSDSPPLLDYHDSLNGYDDPDFDDDKDDSAYVEWNEGDSSGSDMDLGSSDLSSIANDPDDDMVLSPHEVDKPLDPSYLDDGEDSHSHVSLFVAPFVEDERQEVPIPRSFVPRYVNQRSSESSSQSRSVWCYYEETALEEIRRKMKRARLPGETATRANIKHLVTEAQNTPASLRTAIQRVLLTEWPTSKISPRIFTVRTREVYVDASRGGIGFYFEGQWQAWVLNPSWWEVKRCDIQWAEAVAVELGLRLFVEAGLSQCRLKIHSDNRRVVDAIHSDEIYEAHLGEVIYFINYLCRTKKIDCSIEWISGSQNPADRPSRFLMLDERRRFPYDIGIPDRLRNLVFPYRPQT